MGKIFDALEKSNKQKKRVPLSKKGREKKVHQKKVHENKVRVAKPDQKIVPLGTQKGFNRSIKIGRELITYSDPQSIEAELFKELRTNILFPDSSKPPRTILVSSALPGDGKSFVSSNLAVSIANGIEEKVLIMDCDTRKPTIHKIFGINQKTGLSEFLSGQVEATDIISQTPIEKLSVITAGKPPNNPTELLASKKMKNLLSELVKRYEDRYIIIDSPPPAMASETQAIAKYVDGIIVVVKAGRTPRKAVEEVVEQLGKDKILGIILNHAEQKVKKYYGFTKSYYS